MLDLYKQAVANQYAAALSMLEACLERCSDEAWSAPVLNLKFCQVAFHALFFTDLYLGPNVESLREQRFHREHAALFRDYEELEDRQQVLLYTRDQLQAYLRHCRSKAREVIAGETAETLAGPSGFPRKNFSRAELHALNIRHIQHHASQLSLRLRQTGCEPAPWSGSGWTEKAS